MRGLALRARLLVAAPALALLGAPCEQSPDVDDNGFVDEADLAIVQQCFGEQAPFSADCAAADVIADGRIDVLDASRVASALAPPIVPDVTGLERSEAHHALVAAGLQLGAVTETPHLLVPSGSVIGPTPRAGTEMPAGAPVDLLLSAPVPPEMAALDGAWQGYWALTTTTRDPASGEVVAIEIDEAELCAGDPLGISLLPPEASCTVLADAATLSFACSAQRTVPSCTFDLQASFELVRDGDTLSGTGGFSLGGCAGILEPVDENVEVSGTRISATVTSCSGDGVAVSQKLVRSPLLMERLQP